MSADCISAIANSVMAVAAMAGAIAAFWGLNTWKNQSLWHADADLAKSALLSIYTFRDSLYTVRHPAMFPSETELTTDEKEEIVAGGGNSAGLIKAYANRWEKHVENSRELDTILLEADVVWGKELKELLVPLKALEHELFRYIFLHIDAHLRGNTDIAKDYQSILKTKRDILYDSLSEHDEFRADFEAAIQPIEDFLKTKMGRK